MRDDRPAMCTMERILVVGNAGAVVIVRRDAEVEQLIADADRRA